MEELKNEIKQLIISSLELDGVTPEDIGDDEPLFGEGLSLDSVDALELGIAIKKKYGVAFKSGSGANNEYFRSVNTLASYIADAKESAR